MYEIYTDGACLNNGAPDATGGMGVYCPELDIEKSIPWTLDSKATNQRCEMMAVALALAETINIDEHISILSDSNYVVKGMNEWISNWKTTDWTNSKGKPVKNRFLWELLDSLVQNRSNVTFSHVRAHVGIEGNEIADRLAYSAAEV
jgi:ribonuclease HI